MLDKNISLLNKDSKNLSELIKNATNGNIDDETINKITKMANAHLQFNKHNHKVWTGKNGRTLTYIDTPDGKRQLVSKKNDEEMAKFLSEIDYKLPPITHKDNQETIQSLAKTIYDDKLRFGEIENSSYDKFKSNYKRFFVNGVKDYSQVSISDISELDLEYFIKSTINHYSMTQKAFRDFKSMIREIFRFAKRLGQTNITITSFFDELNLSKKIFETEDKKDEDYVFTDDEIKQIMDYVFSLEKPDIRDYGVLLVFFTGLRASEISALSWSDIDEKAIRIHNTEKRHKDENGKYVYEVINRGKTDAALRNIILTSFAKELLNRIRELNPNGAFIFEKDNGERYIGKAFTNKMYSLCKKVGIKKRSIHKARTTYITKMINAGVEETVIINQAGHTDIRTSKQHYEYNNRTYENASVQLENALGFKDFNH